VAKTELGTLQRAVRWAAKLHRGQDRDGPAALPYITHPIDVMNLLRYVAKVEDEAILAAAALHDVVEECGVSFEEIERRFGPKVAGLVKELTRREPSEQEVSGLDEEGIANLRSRILLEEIGRQSPEAQRVKLADRLSNLRGAYATRTGAKLNRYVEQSRAILKIIPRKVSPPLWDEIRALLPKRKPQVRRSSRGKNRGSIRDASTAPSVEAQVQKQGS
jgi:(p)ppGpp synthase/HD superfamily hydrolase